MKKLTILLLMVIPLMTLADDKGVSRFFVQEMVEQTSGIILNINENEEENTETYTIETPSYYDHEIIIMDLRSLVNEYSDVSFYENWTKKENPNGVEYIFCTLWVSERIIAVAYVMQENRLIISI